MFKTAIIAAMLAILGASGAYADEPVTLDSIARQPGPLKEDKVVDLREADGGILGQLERAGVIDSASRFAGLVLLEGNSLGELHYGEYAFKAGEGMLDVERDLIGHRVVRYKLTIPKGLTSEQVVERLREDPVLIGEIGEIPPDGSLEPDTYYFERGETRQSLLTRMAAVHARRALRDTRAQ
jgi:UPF0755 protein